MECQAYCISSDSEISYEKRERNLALSLNDLLSDRVINNFSHKIFSFEIKCPNSTKPINCNSYQFTRSNFYPTEKGCNFTVVGDNTPYDYTVSCARNVEDYELLHSFGHGSFSIDCSPKNVPLGCGIQFKDSDLNYAGPTGWTYINEGRGCQCIISSASSATCYAVCGKIYKTL